MEIDRKDIDRKKIALKDGQNKFISNSQDIYCSPEMIIIKNDTGKSVFNELASYLSGEYKEKEIKLIGDVTYPYYVLTMDWITCGCRFGIWGYYDHIPDDLVDVEKMVDDFENFKQRLETLLMHNHGINWARSTPRSFGDYI